MEASRLAEKWAKEVADSRKFVGPELEFLRSILADHRSMAEALKQQRLAEFLAHLRLIEKFEGKSTLVWWRALGEVSADHWLDWGTRPPVKVEALGPEAEKFQESIREDYERESPGSCLAHLQSEARELKESDSAEDLKRYMFHAGSAPESVRKVIASTGAWMRSELLRLHAAAALSHVVANRDKSASERVLAEKALSAAKAELPKNQQRVADAKLLLKVALDALDRNTNAQRRSELSRKVSSEEEALSIAERIYSQSESEVEHAESELADAKKKEAEYSAEEKALQSMVDVYAKEARDFHGLALPTWLQLVAEVESKVAAVEVSSNRLDADEALFRRASERWLEEAKNLARTKGR